MSDQVVHIAIDVSIADEEIRGRVCDGVRAPKPFCGWLGLIGVLDAMIGSPRHEDKAPPPRAGAPERRD